MKAILEITSERMHGHNRALRTGQSIEVGRSPLVDFPVEHDTKMSDRHFLVHTNQRACYLEDLGSESGTVVNGRPIYNPIVLHDQDEIVAGATSFKILLAGIDDSVTFAPEHLGSGTDKPTSVTVDHESAPSGMQLYHGQVGAVSPAELIGRMRQTLDCFHIIDPIKLGCPLSKDVSREQRLFDWFNVDQDNGESGEAVATEQDSGEEQDAALLKVVPENTPLIVSLESPQLEQVFQQHWGKDAIVTVFWDKGDDPPLEQVRHCAGVFVAPSVLRPQLNRTASVAVKDLVMGIERVLVEDESADSWVLYSLRELDDELQSIGMTPRSTAAESEMEEAN